MHWRFPLGLTASLALMAFALALAPNTSTAAEALAGDVVVLVEPIGRWHVPQADASDYTFFYGNPGDVPLLGDWDGDGVDTPGMFRPDNGFVYLTNTVPPNGGIGMGDPDLTFFFGMAGDQVVVGDWNGDGIDTLGIRRGGLMFLSNVNATTAAERQFFFGVPGDVAFGGDADGDDTDAIYLHRSASGYVYFTNEIPAGSNAVAATAGTFFYGIPGDRFVIGDWDGDGGDSVGIFRPAEARVYLRNTNSLGPADTSYSHGAPSWMPVAGRIVTPDGPPITPPAPVRYTLQVATTPGGGTVSVEPGGHECVDTCEFLFDSGETVTLTAVPVHIPPYGSYVFAGWTGACTGTGPCTLTMSQDRDVGAEFQAAGSSTLAVENPPETQGVIEVSPVDEAFRVECPPSGCTYWFFTGTEITLTAVPEAGYAFGAWSGVECVTNPCPFVLDSDFSVGVRFEPVTTAELPIRINAGGPRVPATDGGPDWEEDSAVTPSRFVNFTASDPGNLTVSWPTPSRDESVPLGTPPWVFATERYDDPGGADMAWNFPLSPAEEVEVRLYFANGYEGATEVAARLFDVIIDDWLVLDDYDIVADVGHQVGVMKRFIVTTDADGLDISFAHADPAAQNPLVNAIEILTPERLVKVEAGGMPAENGTVLLSAMAEVAGRDPGPENRWIVKLAPGVFDMNQTPLTLLPYVEVEGSGETATTITRTGLTPGSTQPDDGTIRGADHAVLRHLTVRRPSGGSDRYSSRGIVNDRAAPTIETVTVEVTGLGVAAIATDSFDITRLFDVTLRCNGGPSWSNCLEQTSGTLRASNLSMDASVGNPGRITGIGVMYAHVTVSNATIGLSGPGVTGAGGVKSTLVMRQTSMDLDGDFRGTYGVNGDIIWIDMVDVTLQLAGARGPTTGIDVGVSDSRLTDVRINVTSGDSPTGIVADSASLNLTNVHISAREDTYGTGWGIDLGPGSGELVRVDSSEITAPSATVRSTGIEAEVSDSTLAGGPVVGLEFVTCRNVVDENGLFYADSCPG